jgi:hypothetical protein
VVVRRETPPPADNFFDALNNVDWEHYVYVKCLVCHGVYRYGIYGFQEGAINCVYCGTLTWNPILVTKDEYRAFLEKRQNPQGMDKFVRSVWGQILTEKGTDEEYQRR